MLTIKGRVSKLNTKKSMSNESFYVTSFMLDNKLVEIKTTGRFNAKEGDGLIVAGMDSEGTVFRAYSYKNYK